MTDDKLLSVTDISKMYDLPRYEIWNLIRRNSEFPEADQYISGNMPLFRFDEIEGFMIKYIK